MEKGSITMLNSIASVQEQHPKKKDDGPVHRNQIILTLCLYAAFLVLGFTSSIGGPALVHVGYLYETDVAGMSIVYTCSSFGYLSGALLCALVFDRFNHELQLFLCTLVMGISSAVLPWWPHLYIYYVGACIQHVAMGFIDSCGQSYIIKLWLGHRFKDPVMQGVHGIWSLGAFIGPFMVGPFLVDLPTETGDDIQSNMTDYNTNTTSDFSTSTSVYDDILQDIDGLEKIRYPYAIVGAAGCIVAAAYLIILCFMKSVTQTKTCPSDPSMKNVSKSGETLAFKLPMLVMQFFFYFFYAWYESIPGGYLSAFVIKGLHWPVHKGPLLTSVFWGALGIGRLLGAPVSIIFSPSTMIAFNIALTTVAFILMLFSPIITEYVLWISVAAAGLGMSTTFASAILWTSNYITITGSIGSLFLIGSSCGGMSGAILAGFLFQNKTHMWVIYLSLLATLVHIVLFTTMSVFAKCHVTRIKKKKGNQSVSDSENKSGIKLLKLSPKQT